MGSLIRSVFCIAALSVLVLGCPNRALGAEQPLSITIGTPHNVFKSGSEITLQIILTNNSDDDIPIGLAVDRTSPVVAGHLLEVNVHDEKGNFAPETKYRRALRGEGLPSDLPVTSGVGGYLSPRKSSGNAIKILVDKFYDLSKPGKYKIEVQWTDPTSKVTVKSNTISVTVTP